MWIVQKNLHSTNEIKNLSSFKFDELYKRYFEEHTPEGLEWVGDVEIIQYGKVISKHQFTSKTLFFKDAYEDIEKQVLKFIDDNFIGLNSVRYESTMRLEC